ncbi:hypothetical protein F5Y13DRAFT_202736 [Hypoxylon sp. FL1857]|nr:hypothetical protein F5Y13DRAFT_202736 [Hypoxylon sp. FL1857]
MATDTARLVDPDDEQHPNFPLTKMNERSSLFLKLPAEIRLMIYRYAVREDRPLVPRQLVRHSNKFTWGPCRTRRVHYPGYGWINLPVERLTAVCLSRTCRLIYADLEYYCPFYQVNRFAFFRFCDLNTYLAAITPRRRQNIWSITLPMDWRHYPFNWYRSIWAFNGRTPALMRANYDALLAQLSQCHGLREHELTIELDLTDFDLSEPVLQNTFIEQVLRNALAWARDPLVAEAQTGRSIWCLPFFRLRLDIRRAMEERKERFDREPQWFVDMESNSSLQDAALELADLHFTGTERVAQDKAASSIGPVSRRTRAKCKASYDTLGAPLRRMPTFNEDGVVLASPAGIRGIRWRQSEVECKVGWDRNSNMMSWENVSIFLGSQHLPLFSHYYSTALGRRRPITLEQMKHTPSPRDIMNIAGSENLRGGTPGNPRDGQKNYNEWMRLVNRWDKRRSRLEAANVKAQRAKARTAKVLEARAKAKEAKAGKGK